MLRTSNSQVKGFAANIFDDLYRVSGNWNVLIKSENNHGLVGVDLSVCPSLIFGDFAISPL